MARTSLAPIYLPPDRATRTMPHELFNVHDGMAVPIGDAHEVLLHVSNDGPSVTTVIIHGGDPQVRTKGNGEDEQVQVAPGDTRFIGPLDPSAHAQTDGSIWIDFTLESVGRITAYRTS